MKLAQTAKVPFWPILKPISEGCRGWRPDKHAKWKLVFWDLLAGCWDESEKRAKSNTCHQLESWWLATHGSIMTRHSRFNNRTVERKSVLLLWPSKRRDKDLQPPKKGCKWKWTKRRTYKCTSPNSSTTRKYLAKKKKMKCELWSPSVYSLLMSVFEKHLSEFDMFSWSFKEDNKFKCRKLLFTVQYINSSRMDLLSNERICREDPVILYLLVSFTILNVFVFSYYFNS